MDRYVCSICGYVYDPEQGDPDNGVAPGTKWEDVPDDWECPVCGASKEDFEKEQSIARHLIFRLKPFLMPFCAGDKSLTKRASFIASCFKNASNTQ